MGNEEENRLVIPFYYGAALKPDSRQVHQNEYQSLLYLRSPTMDLSAIIEKVTFNLYEKDRECRAEKSSEATQHPYLFEEPIKDPRGFKVSIKFKTPFAHCPLELESDFDFTEKGKNSRRPITNIHYDEIILQNPPESLRLALSKPVKSELKGELIEEAIRSEPQNDQDYTNRLKLASEFLAIEIEKMVNKIKVVENEIDAMHAERDPRLEKREEP